MKIGSADHRALFCRWFLDSHESYEPHTLPWPELDEDSLACRYAQEIAETIRRGKSANADDRGMAVAMEVFKGLTIEQFLRTCLAENDRYMAAFDLRLLRPRVVRARMIAIAGEPAP
jgi:hypothetical protein